MQDVLAAHLERVTRSQLSSPSHPAAPSSRSRSNGKSKQTIYEEGSSMMANILTSVTELSLSQADLEQIEHIMARSIPIGGPSPEAMPSVQ